MAIRLPLIAGGGVQQTDFSPLGQIGADFQRSQRNAAALRDMAEQRQDRALARQERAQRKEQLAGIDFSDPQAASIELMKLGMFQPASTVAGMGRQDAALELQRRRLALAQAQAGRTAADRQQRLDTIEGQRQWAIDNNIDPRLVGTPLFAEAAKSVLGVDERMTPFQRESLALKQREEQREIEEAATEAATTKRQTEQALKSAQERAVNTVGAIDRAANRALTSATAAGSGPGMAVARFFSPEDRVALEGDLKQVRANLTFKEIQDLRERGVRLGVLSDADMALLGSIEGALDPDQRPEDLVANLQRIRQIYRKVNPDAIPERDLSNVNRSTGRRRRGQQPLTTGGPAVEVAPGVTIKKTGD